MMPDAVAEHPAKVLQKQNSFKPAESQALQVKYKPPAMAGGFFMDQGIQVEKRRVAPPLGNLTEFAAPIEIIEENGALLFSGFRRIKKSEKEPEKSKISPSVRFRHFLAMRQRQVLNAHKVFSDFKTLIKCGSAPVPARGISKDGEEYKTGAPGVVQAVGQKTESGVEFGGFAWVRKCASALVCFCCAPKIHYKRGEEIKLISEKMYNLGYSWLFITFTCRHDFNTNPVEQVDLFQEAQRYMRSHKKFKKWKKKWGYEYQIRSIELTDDSPDSIKKTGSHFHNHCICYFKHKEFTKEECQECRDELSEIWLESLQKVELWDGVTKADFMKVHAVVAKCPRKSKDQGTDAAVYAAKGASCEMAPGIFQKFGRLPKRISHWEVMALAFTKRPDMINRAINVMLALKGRSWLQYSRGLKDLCGIEDKSDKELMEEDLQVVIYKYEDQKTWKSIDRYKQQAAIREAIEKYQKNDGGKNLHEACDYFSGLVADGIDPLSETEKLKDTQTVARFISSNPVLGRYNDEIQECSAAMGDANPLSGMTEEQIFYVMAGSSSGRDFSGFKRRGLDEITGCSASMAHPYFGMSEEEIFYAMAGQP